MNNLKNSFTIDNYIQIGLLLIAIISIASPIIVSLITSWHDSNIKKLEIDSKIKQEVLKDFTDKVAYLNNYTVSSFDFYKSLYLLNVYFDVDNDLIEQMAKTKYDDNISFQKDVNILMKKLSKQIKYK